jgi:dUTP pyrophosphatase
MIKLLTGMAFPGAPAPELQLQPAGFDLTLRSVAAFGSAGALDLTNEQRKLSGLLELGWPSTDRLRLKCGNYLVTYNEEIGIPTDCAGIVLPRSSLMRCGSTLQSALWDPGYRGRGQGLLIVGNEIDMFRNARIGQLVLIKLETAAQSLYSGQYQGENL